MDQRTDLSEDTAAAAVATPPVPEAVFVTGSTLRHVVVMAGTASVGLIAVFAIDLLSLFYISRLGDPAITAGVGYASVVLFLSLSVNIGMMIAAAALVSRPLGAGLTAEARDVATSAVGWSLGVGLAVTVVLLPLVTPILHALGAAGEAFDVARTYLYITLPGGPALAAGLALSGILRALGDARRAMWVTLAGGIATAVLDPILIFGLHLGATGAAIVLDLSRIAFLAVGFDGVARVHRMIGRPTLARMRADAGPLFHVAGPAILTNVATPIANAIIAAILARFGTYAVAASAIIDRLVPVTFAGIFALSGAVGPILGQNWGAGRFDRMRGTLRDSLLLSIVYVGIVAGILFAMRGPIVTLFAAPPDVADLVVFFCMTSGLIWLPMSLLFVANASFNNLGAPFYSTAFNWGRATVGTLPLAFLGAWLYGPKGVYLGMAGGAILFGGAAIVVAFRVIARLETRGGPA